MGGDNEGWTLPPQSYTARDNNGNSLGEYSTQREADQAVETHYKKQREQEDLTQKDPPTDKPTPPPFTFPDTFKKIFTFLGCAVLLVVGILVAIWIFGWAIATFVVK